MRIVKAKAIEQAVSRLCVESNFRLRPDILRALQEAEKREKDSRARRVLQAVIENARRARREGLAICQDTGMPVVFVEAGQKVHIEGDLNKAVSKGLETGYKQAHLRNSIVASPLERKRSGYTPGVVHLEQVPGDKLKLTVLPKGFGSENKSQLKMFNPTESMEAVAEFIVQAVKTAGASACPPFVVGVGIGGTADHACLLAKKALLKKITRDYFSHPGGKKNNPGLFFARSLLQQINRLNIGPMGLGGSTTALAVQVETYPTHIAGLPVAVNISCHATRSASVTL